MRKPWEKGTEAESARQLFEFQVQGITWMLMRWEKGVVWSIENLGWRLLVRFWVHIGG